MVAFPTKCYEVSLRVVAEGAAPSHVVDIKIPEGSAFLTTPTVAFQDHATHHRIKLRRHSNSGLFLRRRGIHFFSSHDETVCSEPANESPLVVGQPIFGSDLPVSRAAPAKKSAQIISSQ